MILLFLFHFCLFCSSSSFDKKSIFSEWTILPYMHLFSFRLGIFIFFRMLRQIFLSCLASFSAFFRPDEKNLLLFFIRIIRFLRFFRFVGIIFPAFSRPGKEIFLPVFIIFALLPGLPGWKIRIFRLIFARTRRARTCTRVIIYWVPVLVSFSSFRKTCRKTYLKHSHLWIFLQKVWKKVFVKVGGSEKVRNFAPAFERERRWRDDNLKGNGAGSSGSAAVQVSYLNGVKGARTAAGRSQLPPPKKLFEKKLSKKFGGFEKSS